MIYFHSGILPAKPRNRRRILRFSMPDKKTTWGISPFSEKIRDFTSKFRDVLKKSGKPFYLFPLSPVRLLWANKKGGKISRLLGKYHNIILQ